MRPKAYSQIQALAFEFVKPEEASLAMRDFLTKVAIHCRSTATVDLIRKFIKFNIAFNDAEAHARQVTVNIKSEKLREAHKVKIEKEVMKVKLADAMAKKCDDKNKC